MVRVARAVGASLAVLAAVLTAAVPAAGADERGAALVLAHPVDAPVVDPFRPPATPYGPGNRGLEYATAPGTPVGATGDGEVVFAGPVAGALHVTVRHADGIVSTASFLATVGVRVGDRVRLGEAIGTAGSMLHVGVRIDGVYVDPAALFGTVRVVVRLVPEAPPGPPGAVDPAEWAHLAAITGSRAPSGPGVVGRILGTTARVGAGALGGGAELLEHLAAGAATIGLAATRGGGGLGPLALVPGGSLTDAVGPGRLLLHQLVDMQPATRMARAADRFLDWAADRHDCTPADRPPAPPPGRRIAVLVAGLGSTSEQAAIGAVDVDRLGYAAGDVIGFSYAGGRTPTPFCPDEPHEPAPELAELAVRPYDAADSSTDLRHRGRALADLLTEVVAAAPDVPVDVVAHSQGGIVVRLAVAELEERPGGGAVLAGLGLVATIGTPHEGADAATAATRIGGSPLGAAALAGLGAVSGLPLDPHRTSVGDLGRTSPLVRELRSRALPPAPRVLSIGARGDLVVPAARTRLSGAEHATVGLAGPAAHDRLPGDPAVTRELALGLAGAAPTCRSLRDAAVDIGVSEMVDLATDHAGLAIATALGA
jgi:hypothetical protein